MTKNAIILGAGCTGPLLAILLAGRGFKTQIFERRPDPRLGQRETGRSINLALAARGLNALEHAGLRRAVDPWLVPMYGRLVHGLDGSQTLIPYGQRADEMIWSVPRAALNELLLDAAESRGVQIHFGQRCTRADLSRGELEFIDPNARTSHITLDEAQPVFGADGAGSVLRRAMIETGRISAREEFLDHAYKELSIPAGPQGEYQMQREVLHLWPRGGHMLIALPNHDGTFTATLFLARAGDAPNFQMLTDAAAVDAFFTEHYPDARALMPNLVAEFLGHPAGLMGSLYVSQWNLSGQAVLLGDAAHAMVPFHGQGMNCGFEDCVVLEGLLDGAPSWASVFEKFNAERRKDAEAIIRMALENYGEMRDTVRDPSFALQKELSLELERRYPTRFIPKYAMVSFRADIPYSQAESRGAIQTQILNEATRGLTTLAEVDFVAVGAQIEARLTQMPAA